MDEDGVAPIASRVCLGDLEADLEFVTGQVVVYTCRCDSEVEGFSNDPSVVREVCRQVRLLGDCRAPSTESEVVLDSTSEVVGVRDADREGDLVRGANGERLIVDRGGKRVIVPCDLYLYGVNLVPVGSRGGPVGPYEELR